MKIRLALLDADQEYLHRIVSAINARYAEELEVYSFTNPEIMLPALKENKINVLLADSSFDVDVSALPKKCGFAYLVEQKDIESIKGERAVCKFQKLELIFRQVLIIFSEAAEEFKSVINSDVATKLYLFLSPCGGCGSSTAAAACAQYHASRGQNTLYLNLEKYGSSDAFFSGSGQTNMSDLIFALKSKKSNLSLKLKGSVRQDAGGAFFFGGAKTALDMFELEHEERMRLLTELVHCGDYACIVVDMDFALNKDMLVMMKNADTVVWTTDGSDTANRKVTRAFEALSILSAQEEIDISDKLSLLYNKFNEKTSSVPTDLSVNVIGTAPQWDIPAERLLSKLSPFFAES